MGCGQSNASQEPRCESAASIPAAETDDVVEFALSGGKPSSRVSLSISCSELSSGAGYFYVAYIHTCTRNRHEEILRSEVVCGPNPVWKSAASLRYNFGEIQDFRVEIFSCTPEFMEKDSSSFILTDHEFLGRCDMFLGDIFGNDEMTWCGLLQGKSQTGNGGYLKIVGTELASMCDLISMCLEFSNLPTKEFLPRSGRVLALSKKTGKGKYSTCYKTKAKTDYSTLSYDIRGSLMDLVDGDMNLPIKIEVFALSKNGEHNSLGQLHCCFDTLSDALRRETPLILADPATGTPCGSVLVKQFDISRQTSFLDYIRGGTQLQLVVAVDYTFSNGAPTDTSSLHYVDPKNPGILTAYANTILAISNIIGPYCGGLDSMRCAAFGFGGKLEADGPVNHCFPLSGNDGDPFVVGVEGILNAYYSALGRVTLAGPTVFSKTVNCAAEIATAAVEEQQAMGGTAVEQIYTVLLILTDGCIKDLDATIKAIVKASHLPLSILIVGIGPDDFAAMRELDSDDKMLTTLDGESAVRDIVQFVEMNKVADKNPEIAQRELAIELLKELPGQLLDYYKTHHIFPRSSSRKADNWISPPPPSITLSHSSSSCRKEREYTSEAFFVTRSAIERSIQQKTISPVVNVDSVTLLPPNNPTLRGTEGHVSCTSQFEEIDNPDSDWCE